MSGPSLALKIGTLIVGAGILLTLFKKVKKLKKFGLVGLLYVLLASLILGSTSLLLLANTSTDEGMLLIFVQSLIVLAGIAHVLISPLVFPVFREQKFVIRLIFDICILLFGFFFQNLVFDFLVDPAIPKYVWYLALLWFLVPILLNQSIVILMQIPQREYKKWQYPIGASIDDPSDEEMENPVVISFVFQKNKENPESTTFRAKAPVNMS